MQALGEGLILESLSFYGLRTVRALSSFSMGILMEVDGGSRGRLCRGSGILSHSGFVVKRFGAVWGSSSQLLRA